MRLPSPGLRVTHPAHEPTGPLLRQPSLFPRPPLPRLPPLQLRLRHRSPLDGLLELRHLHHDLLGRGAVTVQRRVAQEEGIREEGVHRLQRQAEFGREEVDGERECQGVGGWAREWVRSGVTRRAAWLAAGAEGHLGTDRSRTASTRIWDGKGGHEIPWDGKGGHEIPCI